MESKQQLIIVKMEQLQELQADLGRIHQEQATVLNELVQLTSTVAAYTLSPQTNECVDYQVDSNIGCTEEETASTDHKIIPRPSRTQSNTTPVNNTQAKQQLQVGDHIYIKNKISCSDRPSTADRASIITDIAHQPKQQVFFTTYSRVETWHSPLNLCRLSTEEKIRLRKSQQDE